MDIIENYDRYVLATFDNPTTYLCRYKKEYYFVDNLVQCTKFTSKNVAESYKHYFYQDTGLIDIDLVVLPLKIDYRLDNESNENKKEKSSTKMSKGRKGVK